MKKRRFVLALIMGAVVFVSAAVAGVVGVVGLDEAQGHRTAGKEAPRKYAVRAIYSGNWERLADEASKLGEQGWELVSVIVDDSNGRAYVAYLKREK